jgi:hypothetical protein
VTSRLGMGKSLTFFYRMYIPLYISRIKQRQCPKNPQDPMYAPFVKGGPEGLEDSWDGKIANLFYSVQNVHSPLTFRG